MISRKPKFSIITVCWNESKRIRQTADSIVNQSFKNFEWIVIDGGSTDDTLSILDEYGDYIDQFVSEADGGIYHAMNKGLNFATGDYCSFMNGGDSFFNNCVLEKVALDTGGKDILIGGEVVVRSSGEKVEKTIKPIVNIKDYLFEQTLPHQASFFERKLFSNCGVYDCSFRIIADRELFSRMLLRYSASVGYLPFMVSIFNFDGFSRKLKHSVEYNKEVKLYRKIYFSKIYRIRRLCNIALSKVIGRSI
jgi:glycosyltransferase involved in cell wall biosynthesis